MGSFCLVKDIRSKNRLLQAASGWDDAQIQDRIDDKTCEILSELRDRFPDQLTIADWLFDPPFSVPKLIRAICVELVIGQCLIDAYGSDARISEQGWMILGKGLRALERLKQDPVILEVDGTKIEGKSNLIELSSFEEVDDEDEISMAEFINGLGE